MKATEIRIDQIDMEGTQTRCRTNQSVVDRYAEAIAEGAVFPPIVVFKDPQPARPVYYLAGGFHRTLAHKQAGLETVLAEVHKGTKEDALLYALGENHSHGLPRTDEDKRNVVRICLEDDVYGWSDKSDRWIAAKCKVSPTFVGKVRRQWEASQLSTVTVEKREGRDGKMRKAPQRKPRTDGKISGGVTFDVQEIEAAAEPGTTFDDSKVDELLKKLARALDDRVKVKSSPESKRMHRVCVEHMRATHEKWREWRDMS